MLSSMSCTMPWAPSSRAQWLSIQRIFCTGSSSRDVTSTGRRPTRNASSATRAERFADRMDAKVAKARTSVPTAVANDATVAQFVDASTTRRLRPTTASGRVHRAGWQTRGMLAHVSIQCADFDRSTDFYDTVLAPLGGTRVMEDGDAIGYGIPRCCTSPRSGPSITAPITAGSCVTLTATTSRRSASPPSRTLRNGTPEGESSRRSTSVGRLPDHREPFDSIRLGCARLSERRAQTGVHELLLMRLRLPYLEDDHGVALNTRSVTEDPGGPFTLARIRVQPEDAIDGVVESSCVGTRELEDDRFRHRVPPSPASLPASPQMS